MLFTLLLGAMVGVDPNDPPPLPNPPGRAVIIGDAPPIDQPAPVTQTPRPINVAIPQYLQVTQTPVAPPAGESTSAAELSVPGLPTPPAATPAASAAAAVPPDRWFVMRNLQGNWLGAILDDNRTSISGWIEQSYTGSTTNVTNQPVVWNDRANSYLLNSAWVRLDRAVVTSGTNDITTGYRVDISSGTDYRFSLQRGLFNDQLKNSRTNPDGSPVQNLYGVDPIQFYVNAYIPTLFRGTDIRAGRLFTPWGYESLEGISTPFVSRSYAFNWSPPFTHMGIMVSPTFSNQWAGKFMLANGNDVFLNSPTQELRAVGALTYTSYDKRDTVTFGYTLGRGKFNAGDTFNPATTGEQTEPAGRNNINVLDLVWSHNINAKLNYSAELLYGYQQGVPAGIPGGITETNVTEGTAHWASLAQYLNYVISPQVTSITRFELFDDFDGQRTGFNGLYTAITTGFQIKPYKSLILKPEIRYDYNNNSRPFEGKHDIFTAAFDAIIRF